MYLHTSNASNAVDTSSRTILLYNLVPGQGQDPPFKDITWHTYVGYYDTACMHGCQMGTINTLVRT
jgi:hypothetical protein